MHGIITSQESEVVSVPLGLMMTLERIDADPGSMPKIHSSGMQSNYYISKVERFR